MWTIEESMLSYMKLLTGANILIAYMKLRLIKTKPWAED
jgi:hypothetical protein